MTKSDLNGEVLLCSLQNTKVEFVWRIIFLNHTCFSLFTGNCKLQKVLWHFTGFNDKSMYH